MKPSDRDGLRASAVTATTELGHSACSQPTTGDVLDHWWNLDAALAGDLALLTGETRLVSGLRGARRIQFRRTLLSLQAAIVRRLHPLKPRRLRSTTNRLNLRRRTGGRAELCTRHLLTFHNTDRPLLMGDVTFQ